MTITQQILDYAGHDKEFAAWLSLVDDGINRRLGVGLFDLDDYPLRAAFDDGESPFDIAEEIALENGWDS